MKTELPCAIVRDLLPSYVEGLTEAETTAAVQAHLETCEDCRRRCAAMSAGESAPQTEAKEVDYLKTLRKKSRKKIILAVLLVLVLVLGGTGAKLFLIGTPASSDSVAAQVTPSPQPDSINISFMNMDSASVLTGLSFQTVDDVIEITARKVLISPIHPQEEAALSLNLAGIREVRAFGKTIWHDGLLIDGHTSRLLEKKTAYVGDASAVNDLLCNMDLDAPHGIELQTRKEPYGVTIHFTDTIAENRRFLVEGNACILLALVDNLGEVRWDDPSGYSDTLTLKDSNDALPGLVETYNRDHGTDWTPLDSVKAYSADGWHLQILRNLLGV